MASVQEKPTGKFQLRIKSRLLPKLMFFTFDTRKEAEDYGAKVDEALSKGAVPYSLLEMAQAQVQARAETAAPNAADPLLVDLIRDYTRVAPVTASDNKLLDVLVREVATLRVADITVKWAENYVRDLKVGREGVTGAHGRKLGNLSPGSIRKRVESLARVLDWHWRRETPANQEMPRNPLKSLPRGYSLYTAEESKALASSGRKVKKDTTRDRRMTVEEGQLAAAALRGEKLEGRLRALQPDPDTLMLMELILDTGLRLQEAFTLRVNQVDFKRRIIHVDGSKGHRGVIKPRTVPLKPAIRVKLKERCEGKVGLVFPFWDGSPEDKRRASMTLSSRFRSLFRYIGADDLHLHDLRHEACCRWFELRDSTGRWVFSDVEICKIMGWSDYSMILRYASLRGEDLASRLENLT